MTINNVRIDASIQEIFIRLHEWTNGHIWKNLVFVFGRTERSPSKQIERSAEFTSITQGMRYEYINLKFWRRDALSIAESEIFSYSLYHFKELDERLKNLKKLLFNLAGEQKWKILVNEETLEMRDMTASDFDKMKYITLNVNQNKYCQVGEDGLINAKSNDLCWPMPTFDDNGDYEVDFDTNEPKYTDNKWALVEDIRSFRKIIADFMEHPVKTETG